MVRPLIHIVAEVPDFGKREGKRYSLSAILAMACIAVMCGCRGYRAIAEWGRNYDSEFTEALGLRPVPNAYHSRESGNDRKLNEPAGELMFPVDLIVKVW